MFKRLLYLHLLATAIPSFAQTEIQSKEKPAEIIAQTPKEIEESISVSNHKVNINGIDLAYKATAGTLVLKNNEGQSKAKIFYVSYAKEGVDNQKNRPITFCFNGGPGSSSVWLHLGLLGPKRVAMNDSGTSAVQPFQLIDNPYSVLDVTDLVFIDPVSTGFSRTVPGEDPKQYHGVDEDITSVAEFIRLYTTRYERWESPKFIAGESYGTTRAAGLALELNDSHHICLEGIMLISSVLNFQTINFSAGNDLPYILYLPSYTATAWYHRKLPDELLKLPLEQTLQQAEQFATREYASALMQGDHLTQPEREYVVNAIAKYTGLTPRFVDMSNLRVPILRFSKELLRNEKRTVGRFDSRLLGIDSDICQDTFEFDPSYESVMGLFTATFNEYIRKQLGWKTDEEYQIIADVRPWNYSSATNQYLDVAGKLKEVICKNNRLRVFVASGWTDLATPYYASDYTFNHLNLDPSLNLNITLRNYEGGHMMYLSTPTLIGMKKDIAKFIQP
jgi:carboxypeptidase C (cathepsin A)